MNKAKLEDTAFLHLALVILLGFCAVATAAPANDRAVPVAPAGRNAQAARPSAVKVALNGEDMGTTGDASVLVRRLAEAFEQRDGKFTNGTVFIRAEDDAPSVEVNRVIDAVSTNHGFPISTRGDSEIRWGSFMKVADAARRAGAGMIQLLTLTP